MEHLALQKDFINEMENVMFPKLEQLQRLDNKNRTMNEPPTPDDVLDILQMITGKAEVEELFIDAFNAMGPVLMMAIHVLAFNCLLNNPTHFANQALRCPATEAFKTDPSDDNIMKYLVESSLTGRQSAEQSRSRWDRSRFANEESLPQPQERPSRLRQRVLPHEDNKADRPGPLRRRMSSPGLNGGR